MPSSPVIADYRRALLLLDKSAIFHVQDAVGERNYARIVGHNQYRARWILAILASSDMIA